MQKKSILKRREISKKEKYKEKEKEDSMQLIIAEKPSLGRNIIAALKLKGEKFTRGDGYEKSDNYIVTWCFGHLLALQDMDDYLGYAPDETHYWTMDDLPFFPEGGHFKFVLKPEIDKKTHRSKGHPDPGVKKQFETIGALLKQSDSVVNAGDADREGQVIVDLVLMQHRCSIPAYRLWVNDQTPESISKALDVMKPDSQYRNVLEEGLTRTCMDWLYGINLTRLATLKTRTLLRVGRVIVPVVQEIVARDRAIASFVPKDYLKCVSSHEYNGVKLDLTSKNEFEMSDAAKARALCDKYNAAGGTVTSVKKERKTIAPPKLFSMSKLQAFLEDTMTPQQVLNAAQELYQSGLISYPRTEADYLFPSDVSLVKGILTGYPDCAFRNSTAIFKKPKDDTSHYALIPTGKRPGSLPADQQAVYAAINNRFRAVFFKDPMTADRTTMTIETDGESFTVKGDIIVAPGWSQVEKSKRKDRVLPNFTEGEHIELAFAEKKATTTPPKHYTPSELLSFMKNPFRKEEETDVQLGTEATRAGIIENAVRSEYIEQKGKNYYAMKKGMFLVDSLDRMKFGIDKRQSLDFAEILLKVRSGEETRGDALKSTEQTIRKIFTDSASSTVGTYERKEEKTLGKCPLCGKGQIVARRTKDGRNFYTCTAHSKDDPSSCSFFMDAKFKRFNDVIDITPPKMAKLLAGKTIPCRLTSKKGTTYEANVKLEMNGRWANLTPVFADASDSAELGKCPICGKPVRSYGKFYRCDGHKDGCQFYIGDTMKYFDTAIKMSDTKVKTLLSGGKVKGKSKTRDGKLIDAEFVLKMNGRWANLQRVTD